MKKFLRIVRALSRRLSKKWLIVALLILGAVVAAIILLYLKQHSLQSTASHTSTSSSPKVLQKVADASLPNVDTSSEESTAPAKEEATPQGSTPASSAAVPSKSKPTTTPSQPISSPPFSVSYLYLDQPAVYCAGGGDYYIAQMGNVMVGLGSASGGQVAFGFEATGGIPDNWHGYHQPATVPAGTSSTSFNVLSGRGEPNMAYSEVIWPGHGPATVRAVIYSPNLVYSPPLNVPAQNYGEKCN